MAHLYHAWLRKVRPLELNFNSKAVASPAQWGSVGAAHGPMVLPFIVAKFLGKYLRYIPVVPHKAVAEVSRIGNL